MKTKTILLKCKASSGAYLYYVTNEDKTAGLFYMQGEWTRLKRYQLKQAKHIQDLFTPERVYKALYVSFEVMESSWLELLVVTGFSKEQLLNELYKDQTKWQRFTS